MLAMLRILREVCSLPTAPFAEDRVIAYVRRFAAERNLQLSRDPHGNLLLQFPARRPGKRLVFQAHMDHPGLFAGRMIDARTLAADFRGYVLANFMPGAKVRFFAGGREIPGRIIRALPSTDPTKDSPRAGALLVRVAAAVPPGAPGMFDQGIARARGHRFLSRALDDLAGVAAALAMLDDLARRGGATSNVALLLTRAEEEGFIGGLAAVLRPALLRKTDRIVAIECSAMQPYARLGDGVIIRVGDRTSIFHSALTYFITQQAQALAHSDRAFKFQRALMPGGTCEATVYDIYGYTAACICVPLGNYHNMNRATGRIGPEYIDLRDWRNMVKLFLRLARAPQPFTDGHAPLKAALRRRFLKLRPLLR